MDFATTVYKLTAKFLVDERYGLTSQLRRAAVSISSNIAEGAFKGTDKDFSRFLDTALGSCYEIHGQLVISRNVSLISDGELSTTYSELQTIIKMTSSFKQA